MRDEVEIIEVKNQCVEIVSYECEKCGYSFKRYPELVSVSKSKRHGLGTSELRGHRKRNKYDEYDGIQNEKKRVGLPYERLKEDAFWKRISRERKKKMSGKI